MAERNSECRARGFVREATISPTTSVVKWCVTCPLVNCPVVAKRAFAPTQDESWRIWDGSTWYGSRTRPTDGDILREVGQIEADNMAAGVREQCNNDHFSGGSQ